jgi:hypothetical protein
MKKLIAIATLLCSMSVSTFAQDAEMPNIIVFPSDVWMKDNGFRESVTRDGVTKYLYKYANAFANNREIGRAITAIQKVFADRNFRHEDLQQLLSNIDEDAAMDMAFDADGEGSEMGVAEQLMDETKPDIRVNMDYAVEQVGPRKNISWELKAVDAYCNNQVASVQGNIKMTTDPIDLAMRKAVAGNCDDFCQQIINYFLDLRDNGRKITVVFKVAKGSDIDFRKTKVGATPMFMWISKWMKQHAVNNAGGSGSPSAHKYQLKNVRIPFYDESGLATNAQEWAFALLEEFTAQTGQSIYPQRGSLGSVYLSVGGEE